MSIYYDEGESVFKLDTKRTSYIMGLVDQDCFLGHIYYGPYIEDTGLKAYMGIDEPPYLPSVNQRDRVSFLDQFPMEFPGQGCGDYRKSGFEIESNSGYRSSQVYYDYHKIYKGKKELDGLPNTYGSEEDCETLEIYCRDPHVGLVIVLSYTVFYETDVIVRHNRFINEGSEALFLHKAMSMSLDMPYDAYEVITLHGSWARECHIQRKSVEYGTYEVGSIRGMSSHQEHPFMALVSEKTTQASGDAYGFSFVYSGNHLLQLERNQMDTIRITVGINPTFFKWQLVPGSGFQTPEVMITYSNEGIGGMTRQYHDQIRKHLLRGQFKDRKRPILINNWEATYFDFNGEQLYEIAVQAKALGIELFVMDDGWFGKRDDDNTGLGDWFVNEKKLGMTLPELVAQVNELGMRFGIWFEPEMISPDSDLYREHPDWVIGIPGRDGSLARNQYVLDFSRQEVIEHIYSKITFILESCPVDYIKWDMNRPLSDLGGLALEPQRQGELSHRYMLGVYAIQEKLVSDYPNILLENCASGGGRFDPGMLYYSPQIWASDDTDAIERLLIQEGTAMIYPLSTIGSHVSICPNHLVGRMTPMETRGMVALAGTFGYELDLRQLSQEDKVVIKEQIVSYHRYNDLIRRGDYYRLLSYGENHHVDCWLVVSKDKKEALLTYVQVHGRPASKSIRVRLDGLNPEAQYHIESRGQAYYGSTLMNAGILMKGHGDYSGQQLYIKVID